MYPAVDEWGLTVDFWLSGHRDIAAAKRFFTRAVEQHGTSGKITLDGYPATHAAVAELKMCGVLRPQTKVRTSKYLNNLVERDHRRVKPSVSPMSGFNNFGNVAVTISRIGVMQKIKKGQFNIPKLMDDGEAQVTQVWEVVLAA